MNKQPKKLLDQARDTIRLKHYSICTEESYLLWIKRYILYHHKRHLKDMGSSRDTILIFDWACVLKNVGVRFLNLSGTGLSNPGPVLTFQNLKIIRSYRARAGLMNQAPTFD